MSGLSQADHADLLSRLAVAYTGNKDYALLLRFRTQLICTFERIVEDEDLSSHSSHLRNETSDASSSARLSLVKRD